MIVMEGRKTILPEGVKDLQRIWKTASGGVRKAFNRKVRQDIRKSRKANHSLVRAGGNQSDLPEQLTN
jgi:hypothetical protein